MTTIVEIPTPEQIAHLVEMAVKAADEQRPRTLQSAQGILGPSDIGFCRQKALLTLTEVQPSDAKDGWDAVCGTMLGEGVERDLKAMFPDWVIGSVDKQRVSATLKCATGDVVIGGTPDIVVPAWNAVLDLKSKDGFEWVKRNPWTLSYRFQTWLYVMGCVVAGLLDPSKPMYVGLVYIDRSGKIGKPHVVRELFDPTLEDEIVSWIDDVIYARVNNEEASRDIPAPVCEQICEHFTNCRGGLPAHDNEVIADLELVEAIRLYREGLDMEKAGKALKKEMGEKLIGVNGTTDEWQIRHININPSFVPGYERAGYERIDVRKAR